jgi:hypothetical protein
VRWAAALGLALHKSLCRLGRMPTKVVDLFGKIEIESSYDHKKQRHRR